MNDVNVLVTGGAGFVGARVVRTLVDQSCTVHVITRKQTKLWRLVGVQKDIYVHACGLNDAHILKKLLNTYAITHIFHFATYGSYPKQQSLDRLLQTNIVCTTNILEALKSHSHAKCVVIGSSSEYGKKLSPMKESDLLEPNNLYAASKAAQTHISQVYAKRFGLNIAILRLFNVYGPGEEKGRLVRSVIHSALRGADITLAKGNEARDFIYSEDVARLCVKMLSFREVNGDIFNVGTGKQSTILQLAKRIKKLTDSTSSIVLNAYKGRPWDTTHWKADISKSRSVLQWRARTSLTEGITETIRWYKENGFQN